MAVIIKICLGCSQSIDLYISEDLNLSKNASILTFDGWYFAEGEKTWLALLPVETEFMIRLLDKYVLTTHCHICLKYKIIR
jgi:cAMP phosphodiesterase